MSNRFISATLLYNTLGLLLGGTCLRLRRKLRERRINLMQPRACWRHHTHVDVVANAARRCLATEKKKMMLKVEQSI